MSSYWGSVNLGGCRYWDVAGRLGNSSSVGRNRLISAVKMFGQRVQDDVIFGT